MPRKNCDYKILNINACLDIVSDVTTRFAHTFHKLQRIQIFVNFEIETRILEKQTIHKNEQLEHLFIRKRLSIEKLHVPDCV